MPTYQKVANKASMDAYKDACKAIAKRDLSIEEARIEIGKAIDQVQARLQIIQGTETAQDRNDLKEELAFTQMLENMIKADQIFDLYQFAIDELEKPLPDMGVILGCYGFISEAISSIHGVDNELQKHIKIDLAKILNPLKKDLGGKNFELTSDVEKDLSKISGMIGATVTDIQKRQVADIKEQRNDVELLSKREDAIDKTARGPIDRADRITTEHHSKSKKYGKLVKEQKKDLEKTADSLVKSIEELSVDITQFRDRTSRKVERLSGHLEHTGLRHQYQSQSQRASYNKTLTFDGGSASRVNDALYGRRVRELAAQIETCQTLQEKLQHNKAALDRAIGDIQVRDGQTLSSRSATLRRSSTLLRSSSGVLSASQGQPEDDGLSQSSAPSSRGGSLHSSVDHLSSTSGLPPAGQVSSPAAASSSQATSSSRRAQASSQPYGFMPAPPPPLPSSTSGKTEYGSYRDTKYVPASTSSSRSPTSPLHGVAASQEYSSTQLQPRSHVGTLPPPQGSTTTSSMSSSSMPITPAFRLPPPPTAASTFASTTTLLQRSSQRASTPLAQQQVIAGDSDSELTSGDSSDDSQGLSVAEKIRIFKEKHGGGDTGGSAPPSHSL